MRPRTLNKYCQYSKSLFQCVSYCYVLQGHSSFPETSTSSCQIVKMKHHAPFPNETNFSSCNRLHNPDNQNTQWISWVAGRERDRKRNVRFSQICYSEVAREMAPESYELLMPGLSDSWLPGLWARDASIWASDTWMDKATKLFTETACSPGQSAWTNVITSSNFLALYWSAPFKKFSKITSQRTVPCKHS